MSLFSVYGNSCCYGVSFDEFLLVSISDILEDYFMLGEGMKWKERNKVRVLVHWRERDTGCNYRNQCSMISRSFFIIRG